MSARTRLAVWGGALAALALSAATCAQIPARAVNPDEDWLTHEEAVLLREQAIESAIARGEVERGRGQALPTELITPETRFRIYGRPYPGAPRWHEREAVETLVAEPYVRVQPNLPDFALSANGRWIALPALGPNKNELMAFDIWTGRGWRLRAAVESVRFQDVAFSPVGDLLAAAVHAMPGYGLGEIWLLDQSGALVDRIAPSGAAPHSLAFSPDGSRIAYLRTAANLAAGSPTPIAPEYVPVRVRPAFIVAETQILDGSTNPVSDAFFDGVKWTRIFYAPNGESLHLPRVWTWQLAGQSDPSAQDGSIRYFPYEPLPGDAQAFLDAVDAFSSAGRAAGLEARIGVPAGERLVPSAPSMLSADAVPVDATAAGRLYLSHGPPTREGDSQTLTLETGEAEPRVLAHAPAGVMRQGGADFSSARLSQDGCVLAYFERTSLEQPVIVAKDLCLDVEARADLTTIFVDLVPIQAAWRFEDE